MQMNIVAPNQASTSLAPFSLAAAPCFVERQFPVGRLSAEAYKERKAGAGQTLTALGSYWKGRKPLILVRAAVLGALLPASDDAATDLDIFLKLMAIDDAAFGRRFQGTAGEFARLYPDHAEQAATNTRVVWRDDADNETKQRLPDAAAFAREFPSEAETFTEVVKSGWRWRDDIDEEDRIARISSAFATLPYKERLKYVRRPEECDEAELLAPIWPEVNSHLGTQARSLPELVEQLGIARFGHRPKLGDTFCGGGSIPFEAARVGCDVYASDLNPIACMLTWGAFNIVGASREKRAEIEAAQKRVAAEVDAEITRLGIEHDAQGNRAKAYLYCLETRCPKTGWMVPMAPSWIISRTRKVVAKLKPDPVNKRYDIEIFTGVSAAEMAEAAEGTVRGSRLVHPMNPEHSGVELKTVRRERRDSEGVNRNDLRSWENSDITPHPDDLFQERLYCIQWIAKASLNKGRPETYFSTVTAGDLARERKVEEFVRANLSMWQNEGLLPDTPIEPGDKTDEPIRTRGWTHWVNLFVPRHLLILALFRKLSQEAHFSIPLTAMLNFTSRLTRWAVGSPGKPGVAPNGDFPAMVFSNQALNTFYNYAERALVDLKSVFQIEGANFPISGENEIQTLPAKDIPFEGASDIFVTDPPYADAVNYHEITEFFIAWLRKNPPPPFDKWTWNSRRDLAIKGKDEHFRRDMVAAYAAMTKRMPGNGMQVVMFTHQDAGVWADLGSILWAAGLRVTAAWNVVTETESALKEGNYVQGTVCLVLRKRLNEANARRMEIEADIEDAVRAQIDRLTALDDAWHERADAEQLYTDGDLTLAAYAAALQVVTSYSTIDRQPLDRDLYRKLGKGERTMLRELVDYAAQIANGLLVPQGFPKDMWRDLVASERFYVRMLDMEAKGSAKVADFQNFARSFAYSDYTTLMASTAANSASLAGSADLKGRMLDGEGFAKTQLRQVLFAIWKSMEGARDPKRGVTILRTEYAADYWQRRQKLIALASYVALKTKMTRPEENAAGEELAEALKLDRI